MKRPTKNAPPHGTGSISAHEVYTLREAGRRMGLPQPKVSSLLRGDFTNLSERKLMACLNKLGYDIEITVKPAADPVGHLTLAVA